MSRVFSLITLIFAVSQLYWFVCAYRLLRKRVESQTVRIGISVAALSLYVLIFALQSNWFGRRPTPIRMTLYDALVTAPAQLWAVASMTAFLLAVLIWMGKLVFRAFAWARRKPADENTVVLPARRQFLERTATAAIAAPFFAGAYGMLYGRLNLEITRVPIHLSRLPKEFEGFRIAQLTDIHIGPFMSEEEIRKYAGITNSLKPDLIVLTGDYITWDPRTQQPLVNALSGLKARFGVFGCLGNHETWSNVEDSISELFYQAGIRILRQEHVPITAGGESLNLIGVDFLDRRRQQTQRFTGGRLNGVEKLIAPGKINILLSHNPSTFDRAAELGIDLSLAGHTHGGQVTMEYIHPNISPSRLITPYVKGWYEQPGGQIYVNRGIGTMFVPIRLGAPPEISVFELTRKAS